jgi:superfamily II DNA or RNA helicase
MEGVKDKLLPFQIDHTNNLVRIIKNNNAVLDAADTGAGKTYTGAATCKILELTPTILCTKSVVSTWSKVCEYFELKPKIIVNYETIRLGKCYTKNRDRVPCKYIKLVDTDKNQPQRYKWLINDASTIFIFDEAHKCSNIDTYNGQLLYAAKLTGYPIMLLSATIADNVEKFKLFFWILNFIDPEHVKRNKIDFDAYMNVVTHWALRDKNPMLRIHNMLYPNRASRMRIDALRGLFPETHITAQPYNVGKKRELEIERQYKIIAQELDNLQDKSKRDKQNMLVKILRAHQRIELLKAPIFVELANDFIENGYSVVIFVNFTQTLKLLSTMLKTKYFIYGQQSQEERDRAIELFNSNKINVILCNIKAGGVGISLHDIHGQHPRASLISPTWNSTDLVQALGRIHRAGGKSMSLQRIIYVANTIEEKIADKLKHKLNNLNSINNGDLDISGLSTSVKFKQID